MKTLPAIFRLFRRAPPNLLEPSWADVLENSDERESAASYWREVTAAMRSAGTLKQVNAHAVLRLVVAYLVFDRTSEVVLRRGASIETPALEIQRKASLLATRIERELGLSPPRERVTVKN
jgi:phage terminase small subunit